MVTKMRLTQKMTQRMALTPQMRQSIHILQLPPLELKTYLEQQIQENPMLEDSPVAEFKDSKSDKEIARPIELSNENRKDSGDYFNTGYSQEETEEKQNYLETLIIKQPTLQEYLLRQLGLQPLNEIEYKIGELIIGNIDEKGDKKQDGERIPASDIRYLTIAPGIGWSCDKIQALLVYQRTLMGTNTDANDSVVVTLVYPF